MSRSTEWRAAKKIFEEHLRNIAEAEDAENQDDQLTYNESATLRAAQPMDHSPQDDASEDLNGEDDHTSGSEQENTIEGLGDSYLGNGDHTTLSEHQEEALEEDLDERNSDLEEIGSDEEPNSDSGEMGSDDDLDLEDALAKWAIDNNITTNALRELLHILGRFHNLPRDPRTLKGQER